MAFKLSAVLYGHQADVRGLSVTHDGCIVSCSRDKSAKLWKPNSLNTGYTEVQTFHGHKNFVTSVCTLPPNECFPNGLIVTGGNDNLILIFEPSKSDPVHKLSGHKNTVCKLVNGNQPNNLISASWDKTAKVWSLTEEPKCLLTIEGHEAAVWAVLAFKNLVITGSADKLIKVFDDMGNLIKTLKGHGDCVRDLAAISDEEIISCSNDATIRLWSISKGDCVNILYGHPNFIYSVSVFQDIIVSGGEDRICTVWFKGNQEFITLPAQSVWTVKVLSNNDIVTGSSDGVIRVFTADTNRQAGLDILTMFADEVANFKTTAEKYLGGIKVSDLPDLETLKKPGTKEGQTKLVRENEEIVCYSWSVADQKWNKLGNVMGGNGGTTETSGKVLYEGKEYDYVFSVDVEDGKPPIKLPYNKSEDPWFAAQAFIHKHDLPQVYLEQVAYFIINNSKQNGVELTPPPQEYMDPFTGGSRYVPSGSSVAENRGVDPFTGSNRYVPMEVTTSDPPIKNDFFPQTTYLRFDQANLKQISDKLLAFNNEVAAELKLIENDLGSVFKLADAAFDVTPESVNSLKQLLNWPKKFIFPVLDILRLAVRNPNVNNILCSDKFTFGYLKDNLQPDSVIANQMLSLRTLCNMFCHKTGEELVLGHKDFLIEAIGNCSHLSNKNVQIALVTLALNMTVAFYKSGDIESQSIILLNLLSIFPQLSEQEAVFRALVTLGTILIQSNELSNCIDSTIKQSLENYSSNGTEKVKQCSKYVLNMLS